MKKIGLLFGLLFFIPAVAFCSTLMGYQGGTGYGSASSTSTGYCLTVASTSPFLTYNLSACAGGSVATTTINGGQYAVFTLKGDNSTITSTVSGATTTFSVLPNTFYPYSGNPSSFLTAATGVTTYNGASGAVTGLASYNVTSTNPFISVSTTTTSASLTFSSSSLGLGTAAYTASTQYLSSSTAFVSTFNGTSGAINFHDIGTGNITSTVSTSGGNTTTTFSLTGVIPIANGGTNATTSAAALTSLGAQAALSFPLSAANGGTATTTALGSNAFNSTAYLPLTGGTLSGNVTGTSLNLSTSLFVSGTSSSLALNLPEGICENEKIVPSVTSNNLTVALKTLAGTDPSATDPVYCRIGGVVRSITGALSTYTMVSGYSWFNSGSAELATKEIDYFTYLLWDGTAVGLGISRIPYGNVAADFYLTDNYHEKSLVGSANITSTNITNVVNIGRFAATLSAGAGYTWSVPTYTASNLIQRPIFNTRPLGWTPTWGTDGSAFTNVPTVIANYYVVTNGQVTFYNFAQFNGTSGGTGRVTMTTPFTTLNQEAIYGKRDSDQKMIGGIIYTDGKTYSELYDGTTEISNSTYWRINGTYDIQ